MSSSSDDDESDVLLAELAGFALAGRPERVEDGMLALAPPPFRDGLRYARAILTVLGLAEPPAPPRAELRDRVLETLRLRPKRRAVLVIDMIRDHLDPQALLEVPRARAVVPALAQRLDEARRMGVPIVYVVDEHDADDPDLDAWGTHAVKGTAGASIWTDLAPSDRDHVVKKPSYSAFFRTTLAPLLDQLGVETLVLTGCLTEIGIMATATDAMQLGFAIEVPHDSQAGSCALAETAALGTLAVMAPFGPARRDRLDRLAALAA